MLRAISAPQAWINRKVTIYHLKRITPIFLPSDSDGFLEISAIFSRFVRNYSIAQYGNMPLDDRISQAHAISINILILYQIKQHNS
jgi:hypothetical protein